MNNVCEVLKLIRIKIKLESRIKDLVALMDIREDLEVRTEYIALNNKLNRVAGEIKELEITL